MWVKGRLLALIVVGMTALSASVALALTGDLDPGFNTTGERVIDFGGKFDGATAALVQSGGKIVLVGNGQQPGTSTQGLVATRLGPDGSTDTTFAGGVVHFDFGSLTIGAAAVQAPDGKIVMAATTFTTNGNTVTLDEKVVRMSADGTPDTSWGPGGVRSLGYGGFANAVAVQPDGKVLVVGSVSASDQWPVARLNTSGHYDGDFAGRGLTFLPKDGSANAIALQADGKILVAGNNSSNGMFLARLNSDGTPDTTFGANGLRNLGDGSVSALLVQPDQKIVLGETIANKTFRVARLNPNGTPDTGFGSGAAIDVGFSGISRVHELALQPDLKIVAVGDSGNDMAVARIQPGGQIDTTFSSDGKQLIDFGANVDQGQAVAIQPDGDLAVAGNTQPPGSGDTNAAVARLQGNPVSGGGVGGGGGGGGGSGTAARCAGKRATIVGTNGKDRLKGTNGPDVIVGLGGNDTISGLDGNDVICGGAGNDKISGGDGNDREYGEVGKDTVSGGDGKDTLSGGDGNDKLSGGDGKDKLSGGDGADKLSGGDGKDSLNGGGGKDSCSGHDPEKSC